MPANSTAYACFRGIVPPHILESIMRRGSPDQRAVAQATLALTEGMRAARIALAETMPPPAEAAGAPHRYREIYDTSNSTNLPGNLVRSEGQSATNDIAV